MGIADRKIVPEFRGEFEHKTAQKPSIFRRDTRAEMVDSDSEFCFILGRLCTTVLHRVNDGMKCHDLPR